MAKAQEAADAIRASIKMYKNLAEYAEYLEGLGSLEQAKEEAGRALAIAQEARDKAHVDFNLTMGQLNGELEAVKAEIKEASTTAANTIKRAREEASVIVGRANDEASQIVANAVAKGAQDKAILAAELAGIQEQIKIANADFDNLIAGKNAALAEFTAITGKIEAAKAQIAQLLK